MFQLQLSAAGAAGSIGWRSPWRLQYTRDPLDVSEGGQEMLEAAVPAFIEHGLGEYLCLSDPFTPSALPIARHQAARASPASS